MFPSPLPRHDSSIFRAGARHFASGTDSEAREICTDVATLESDRTLDALVLNPANVVSRQDRNVLDMRGRVSLTRPCNFNH